MAFNKYYQDELNSLRELGAEFSEQNPGLSKFLSEEGDDPDVERLLEGFSFLSGRIRQKLEDDLPEISHSLINVLWPNYLRPVPSMSVLEFQPRKHVITSKKTIKKGAEVQSIQIDKVNCLFRTCTDVDIFPLEIMSVASRDRSDGSQMDIKIDLESGVAGEDLDLKNLKFYLHDDQKRPVSRILYLWLFRYLEEIELHVEYRSGGPKHFTLNKKQLQAAGFEAKEALLPGTDDVFSGYRLIQEFFQLPEKFLFFNINDIGKYICEKNVSSFKLSFKFNRAFDGAIKIRKDNIRLHCTPIANLFARDADPILLEHNRNEYMVRPQTDNLSAMEVFSIEHVEAKVKGQSTRVNYLPFESFQHQLQYTESQEHFYKLNARPSVLGEGLDYYISFHSQVEQDFYTQTVSIDLLCTNRQLAQTLQADQITYETGNSPEFVQFSNITKATHSLVPPIASGLHWRLISNLALHYRSIASIEGLRTIVKLYDFASFVNRQSERTNKQMCEGIEVVETNTIDILKSGIPTMGLETTLTLRESKFGAKGIQGEANMFLFASLLNRVFAQYASANSFHRLVVKASESGETYKWPIINGAQTRY